MLLSDLIAAMGGQFVRKGWKLATAESCTGGLLAHWITSEAGCSQWYNGGVVAYANGTKVALLGVPETLLASHGAVSRVVAMAMAQGACQQIPGTDLAIGITGIAGPGGATPDKPVGCVYLGLAGADGSQQTMRLDLTGGRAEIQIAAGKAALQMIYDKVSEA